MLPHPDTVHQLATIDYQQRQQDAARARLVDQAARGRTPGVATFARLQDALGRTLIGAGLRIRGVAPVPGMSDGSPAIESGAIR